MNITFVTGNPGKAKYFSNLIGRELNYKSADMDEIQSLDLREIVTYKIKQAYEQLKTPVIVEDTGLSINSFGNLPGPFIKWFEKEVGLEKICRMADWNDDRAAVAASVYGFFDGGRLELFEARLNGVIPSDPLGEGGYGWNPIFIPEGSSKTLAEMSDEEFQPFYLKYKPIEQIKKFLDSIDK